jgi:hypothetical protein
LVALDATGSGFDTLSAPDLIAADTGFVLLAGRTTFAAELVLNFWKSSSCVNAKRRSSFTM